MTSCSNWTTPKIKMVRRTRRNIGDIIWTLQLTDLILSLALVYVWIRVAVPVCTALQYFIEYHFRSGSVYISLAFHHLNSKRCIPLPPTTPLNEFDEDHYSVTIPRMLVLHHKEEDGWQYHCVHRADNSNLEWRTYSDGSGKNGDCHRCSSGAA